MTRLGCSRDRIVALACLVGLGGCGHGGGGHADAGDGAATYADAGDGAAARADGGTAPADVGGSSTAGSEAGDASNDRPLGAPDVAMASDGRVAAGQTFGELPD